MNENKKTSTKPIPLFVSFFFLIPTLMSCKKFCIFTRGLSYRCIQHNKKHCMLTFMSSGYRYFNVRHCFLYHNKSIIFFYMTDCHVLMFPFAKKGIFPMQVINIILQLHGILACFDVRSVGDIFSIIAREKRKAAANK